MARFTDEEWANITLAVHLLWEGAWGDDDEQAYGSLLQKVRKHRLQRLQRRQA